MLNTFQMLAIVTPLILAFVFPVEGLAEPEALKEETTTTWHFFNAWTEWTPCQGLSKQIKRRERACAFPQCFHLDERGYASFHDTEETSQDCDQGKCTVDNVRGQWIVLDSQR